MDDNEFIETVFAKWFQLKMISELEQRVIKESLLLWVAVTCKNPEMAPTAQRIYLDISRKLCQLFKNAGSAQF